MKTMKIQYNNSTSSSSNSNVYYLTGKGYCPVCGSEWAAVVRNDSDTTKSLECPTCHNENAVFIVYDSDNLYLH